jgi:hypothetical protein
MVLGLLVMSVGLFSLADSVGLLAARSAYGLPSYLNLLQSEKREVLNEVSTFLFSVI